MGGWRKPPSLKLAGFTYRQTPWGWGKMDSLLEVGVGGYLGLGFWMLRCWVRDDWARGPWHGTRLACLALPFSCGHSRPRPLRDLGGGGAERADTVGTNSSGSKPGLTGQDSRA